MEKLIRECLFALLMSSAVWAQAQGVHEGMLRAQGTLALGVGNAQKELRYFVYGELEYLVDDHVGLNGAVYAQLGSSKDEFSEVAAPAGGDYFAHSVFAGPVYHFKPDSPLDLYVGLQPGLHLTKSPEVILPFGIYYPGAYSVSPAASVNVGIAYYGSFFHLFGQLRALTGTNLKAGSPYGIAELRPTFGLGFNIF